jgi:hypothetical protein
MRVQTKDYQSVPSEGTRKGYLEDAEANFGPQPEHIRNALTKKDEGLPLNPQEEMVVAYLGHGFGCHACGPQRQVRRPTRNSASAN